MAELKIDLLYFERCPSWKNGLENLKTALKSESINDTDIQLVLIANEVDAMKEKFLGSPSFRINGQDLWPEDRKAYFLGCRVYLTEEGMKGFPTADMLRIKLQTTTKRQK